MWIGTEYGLVRYDGHRTVAYRFRNGDTTSLCNDHVNTLLYSGETGRMAVGTDAGLSVYDFRSDRFYTVRQCGYRQVKSLLRDGDRLWVGTAEGLMYFSCRDGIPSPDAEAAEISSLPSSHITCCRKIGQDIWFGAYDWVYRLRPDGTMDKYALPRGPRDNLVLDITAGTSEAGEGHGRADAPGQSIWLGTEMGLFHFSLQDNTFTSFLDNTPVKYFFRYNDRYLWIGTDNGLFIKDRDNSFIQYRHEAENSNSLPNNVVWSIFRDAEDNVFLCTDHGIAIAKTFSDRTFRSIGSVTESNEGQDISTMTFDSRGNLWLGGMNGLIMEPAGGGTGKWYKSDSGPAGERLSHNKIRGLLDDRSGLWTISDGGLDRIDYSTGKIRHFTIREPSGKNASSWMYSICKDRYGRLWLSTYSGIIVISDVDKLLRSDGPYMADLYYNASTSPSISGNVVVDLAVTGSFVATLSGGSVDFIDLDSGETSYVEVPGAVYTLESDGENVWIGTDSGLYRLDADRKVTRQDGFSMPVEAIVVNGREILAISGRSLYIDDTASGTWKYCPSGDSGLFCGIAGDDGTVYLGTVDGYFMVDTESIGISGISGRTAVTALLMDNSIVEVGKSYDGNVILPESLGMTSEIVLKHSQNSFGVEFSTFEYSGREEMFAYRLKGLDGSWQITPDHSAVFINIPSGEYRFEVCPVSPDGTPGADMAVLDVRVKPVWYATTTAFVAYLLILGAIGVWVFFFVRIRHQLQIEHIEREEALNTVKMKTEFFENVSHEFKSPLSIILGFVSKMLSSESDAMKSRELKAVQKNAEKMHLLINQMIDYNENGGETLFIPSSVSLPEMAKEVFDSFAPAFAQKNISARFVADEINYIFMLDKVKMESVFQNLLSNAVKFTPEGGTILMSVTVGEETPDMIYADVKVEDSGCGIKEDELPFIFNQYYKAPSNQKYNVNGSGIGLHLTKEIVEQHKGRISVTSAPGKGTCFTVRLSTMKADSFILDSGIEDNALSLHSLSKVWQHERKPILLLVEDNKDIRDFITASLGKDFTFLVAGDGRPALELLETEKIDLVITDIAMPGMDGLALSRAIRSSVRTAFLPIIILTGRNDMQTQLKSLEYADAFITKPFDINYLNSRIIQLLIKHEQYLDKMRQQQMLAPEQEQVESPDGKFLREIVEIVNRHIGDPEFSASVLCEESHYGSKQIYRKIKQLTGMGVVEFIRDIRLQKAAAYLSQKKLSVSEIMYMVGFTTASYFAKCFKAKYGVSPSEYTDTCGSQGM